MKVLFLSAWYPYPPTNGSKLRISNLLRGLAQQHEVSLVSFTDQVHHQESSELAALCTRVNTIKTRAYRPQRVRSLLGFFQLAPRYIADTYSQQMDALIRREVAQGCDLVIASEWSTAAYYPAFQSRPAIFEDVEVGIFESKRATANTSLGRLRHGLPLLKMKFYLRQVLQYFRVCTVVSNAEAAGVRRMAPGFKAIQTIPNGVDLNSYSSATARSDDAGTSNKLGTNSLIFAGSFNFSANYDAMQWFVAEILPRVCAQVPDAHLVITGDHAGLPLPSTDHVTLAGFVDDIQSMVAGATISIAPIRQGGGTRLKILEAMALRTPVVATSKGAEGLAVRDGEHLLIADTPEAFAQAVIRLLCDADLRRKIAQNAYELVQKQYDWRVIMPRFLNLVEQARQGIGFEKN